MKNKIEQRGVKMSKEEIKEGMENVAGGTDATPGKKPGSDHKIIRHDEHLIRMPKMPYGGPCIEIPEKPEKHSGPVPQLDGLGRPLPLWGDKKLGENNHN